MFCGIVVQLECVMKCIGWTDNQDSTPRYRLNWHAWFLVMKLQHDPNTLIHERKLKFHHQYQGT
ncbi:hypothetical protein VFPPC_17738 [Pochonia chlamydosporia 170]|uniref:Uncharacterized protein n=1 Tax=Pochonia chlamydosporia 170 TaxID=1380566 RepID=A0A219AQM6_METCM|nr:hypothetical protein VFPPC_17738 [Pochonia chlamydosporia 170]OWT43086.1 hypothetical protein VFPPC_17738 [Pochonia chlamydosporia 170]